MIGLMLVTESTCGICPYRDHEKPDLFAGSPARLHPCLRLGPETNPPETTSSPRFSLPLIVCHHPDHPVITAAECARCPDYLFPLVTPETPPSDIGPMLELPPRSQPDGWWNFPNAQEGFRQAADRFVSELPPYSGAHEGRGIVIVGGGEYFTSAYVSIRVIRHVGCRLPIQLWHFAGEITDAMRQQLAPHGVECVDADEMTARRPFRFLPDSRRRGWQLKPYAITHSPFREVLYLDADCYPTRDPEFMFDWAPYRERGAVFWPDLATSDHLLPTDRWAIFGTKPGWAPLESGQLMVNKETCWRELRLALWYNERADYAYQLLYGDKDTFNIAWRRLGTYYAMTQPRPDWDLHTYLHFDSNGEVLFQHRTRDKFRRGGGSLGNTPQLAAVNVRNPRLQHEDVCFEFLGELLRPSCPGESDADNSDQRRQAPLIDAGDQTPKNSTRRKQNDPTPLLSVVEMSHLIRGPIPREGWPEGWAVWENTRRAHQLLAQETVDNRVPFPSVRFSGRGVVIAAGGKYWPSAYVTVRMLRHVGCALPAQIWYLGASRERDERFERLVAPWNVTCVDADSHPARAARRSINGFGLKLFAVMNSPFEEVLSLDGDNYPCADPTVLFDDPRYQALGGIYWPDLPETEGWTRWPFWGVEPRGPCGLETGQYVVHKKMAWDVLRLAEFYDDHPDWCHQAHADYGDKGPHRVAWAKFKRDYVVFHTQVKTVRDIALIQDGPNGRTPMFCHRCRSKFVLDPVDFVSTPQEGHNLRLGLPLEEVAFGFLKELRELLALSRS